MKYFGDTINQLIQRENERMTVRRKGKHKVKRNRTKPRGPRQSTALSSMSTPIPPNALTDPNYLSSLLPNNPSSLPPNLFAGTQSTMPLTATRNPSATTATKRAENSTLAGLLTPNPPGGYSTAGGMSTSNGTSQYGNSYPGQSLSTDAITNKPLSTPKSNTPMTGINAGLSSRSIGKGSRGGGASGTAPKRLVRIVISEKVGNACLDAAEHRRKRRRRLLLLLECHRIRMFNRRYLLLIWKLKMIRNR